MIAFSNLESRQPRKPSLDGGEVHGLTMSGSGGYARDELEPLAYMYPVVRRWLAADLIP